ncbi:MAG: hypothetical protein ACKONH_03120 [Planctomycetia bacterium]
MPRFALLEHTGAPDDPAGLHYDLLVESGAACRTWRLAAVPRPDGPAVAAVELAAHRLAWLDHEAGPVSGGRGFARRIDGGSCDLVEPAAAVALAVDGRVLRGRLALVPTATGWEVRLAAAGV